MAYMLAIPYIAAAAGILMLARPAKLLPGAYLPAEPWPRWGIVVISLGIALIIWGILAAFLWLSNTRLACADGANLGNYEELTSRLSLLESRLNGPGSSPCDGTSRKHSVCASARSERDAAREALDAPGMQWLRGTGYIDVLTRVHRAEEEYIEAQERDQLIGDACEDLLRLRGCNIANRDELIRNLRLAAVTLEPKAKPYFADLTTTTSEPVEAADGGSSENRCEGLLRAILKTVRRALNDYTDTQRIGLLQVRNRILITVLLTEVVALFVLELAILAGADLNQILAATAFFLVGTVLGLVYIRLYTPLETQPAVAEDYGLGRARLLATPLFSGLAAVAGVLLVAVVPDVVNIPDVVNAKNSSGASNEIPTLDEIFAFHSINFLFAAIFGLSPALLFKRLGPGSELLSNLNSAKPTSQPSP